MPPVNTVLGPVDPADLGFTLSHEHVLLSAAGVSHTYPGFIDHQQVTDDGAAELKGAYDEGVRTIIDVTTFDLGRDIRLLAEVSRRSGVHIVALHRKPPGSASGIRRSAPGHGGPFLHT